MDVQVESLSLSTSDATISNSASSVPYTSCSKYLQHLLEDSHFSSDRYSSDRYSYDGPSYDGSPYDDYVGLKARPHDWHNQWLSKWTSTQVHLIGFKASDGCVADAIYHVPDQVRELAETIRCNYDLVEYQIILVDIQLVKPFMQLIDALGLGLDIPPHIWAHLCNTHLLRFSSTGYGTWITRDDNLIQIRNDFLLILDSIPDVRPKTALVWLHAPDNGLTGFRNFFPAKAPSALERSRPDNPTLDGRKGITIQTLHWWTLHRAEDIDCHGRNNFLFTCLEGMIRLQITKLPQNVPYWSEWNAPWRQKYQKHQKYHERLVWSRSSQIRDPREFWNGLRDEIGRHRVTLQALPEFVETNFDMSKKSLIELYGNIGAQYERHLKEQEIIESRLKDQIDILSSSKATEMAELSIKESRRVMLLTVFAFVFLPISLAGTVVGMNVQQINGTDHDLRNFVITALALLATTLLLWIVVAAFVYLRRSRIIGRQNLENREELRNFKDWVVDVLFLEPVTISELNELLSDLLVDLMLSLFKKLSWTATVLLRRPDVDTPSQ